VTSQAASSVQTSVKQVAKRFARNLVWLVLSEAIAKGVFFITNIYLSRTLGVENFGLFTLAQALTFYFWLAVDLGTNMYGVREIAKNKENVGGIINPLLTLRITAGVIVFFLYSMVLLFLDLPTLNKITFIGCGLYLLTYAFYSDWVLKGLEKFKYVAFGSLVASSAFLVGTVSLVRSGSDVTIASFIWSISYLIGSMSLFYCIYRLSGIRLRPSFDLRVWLSHVRNSIYIAISGGLLVAYQYVPILLLSALSSNYEVGVFGAPYRVVITVCSTGFLVSMAFYPVFSELCQKDRQTFLNTQRNFRTLMILAGLGLAIIGRLFSKDIVLFLFGKQYIDSVPVFATLVFLVPLYFLRFTYGTLLLATGHQKKHIIGTSCGVVSALCCGLILIYSKGPMGGAISLLIAEAVLVGVFWRISKHTFLKTCDQR
jgi:O-antigen/teichoic acid export membrane protein